MTPWKSIVQSNAVDNNNKDWMTPWKLIVQSNAVNNNKDFCIKMELAGWKWL